MSAKFKVVVSLGAGLSLALVYVMARLLRKHLRRDYFPASLANGSVTAPRRSDHHKILPKSMMRHRHSSLSSDASTSAIAEANRVKFKDDLVDEAPLLSARDNLADAIRQWERALSTCGSLVSTDDEKRRDLTKIDRLEQILDKAYCLRDEMNDLLVTLAPAVLDLPPRRDHYLTYSDIASKSSRRTLSVLSDDSFVSALDDLVPPILDIDIPLARFVETDTEHMMLYQEALREVDALNVLCRVLRTDFLKCKSDDDFLAKLYCIRLAFDSLLQDSTKRDWLALVGRDSISALLAKANKDFSIFHQNYDKMIAYATKNENWPRIEDELRGRKLVEFSFYDVVLDFIFMDAFEDLADPPSSVVAVAQSRFLSASIVQSTLSAVIWSVLKTKRARLKYADGFIAHYYDISENISPTMAWGFLGTDAELKELCNYFKSQVCNFLIDLFNCERVRFTTVDELSQDIWHICQTRAKMTREILEQ